MLTRKVHSLTGRTREVKFNHYFPLIGLFPHKLGVDISRHQLASHRQWSSRTRNIRLARGEGRQQGNTARYEKAVVVHPLTGLFLTQYLVYSLTTTLAFTLNRPFAASHSRGTQRHLFCSWVFYNDNEIKMKFFVSWQKW